MSKVDSIAAELGDALRVEISQDYIILMQGDRAITLSWKRFEKLAAAISAITVAHANLWFVNKPEAVTKNDR